MVVFGRPLGQVQITCPRCGFNNNKFPVWRTGQFKCERQCSFHIGLGFSTSPTSKGHLVGKWNGYVSNQLNPKGTPYDGCNIYGRVEFKCPNCSARDIQVPDTDYSIECLKCGKEYYLSVLIYSSPNRFRQRCPIDWVFDVKESLRQTIPTQEADSCPRTTS